MLVAGDNLEHPLPYLYSADLPSYVHSLESYLELEPKHIITGHGPAQVMTLDLLHKNLAYIEALAAGREPDRSAWDDQTHKLHEQNMSRLQSFQ